MKSELNFGTPLANKSWTGMSGIVQRDEADIMLGPPLMNAQRMEIMHFSVPLMLDKISILSHFTKTNPTFDYLRGFDSYVWSFLFITCLLSIALFLLRDWLLLNHISFQLINKYIHYYMQLIFSKSECIFVNNFLS